MQSSHHHVFAMHMRRASQIVFVRTQELPEHAPDEAMPDEAPSCGVDQFPEPRYPAVPAGTGLPDPDEVAPAAPAHAELHDAREAQPTEARAAPAIGGVQVHAIESAQTEPLPQPASPSAAISVQEAAEHEEAGTHVASGEHAVRLSASGLGPAAGGEAPCAGGSEAPRRPAAISVGPPAEGAASNESPQNTPTGAAAASLAAAGSNGGSPQPGWTVPAAARPCSTHPPRPPPVPFTPFGSGSVPSQHDDASSDAHSSGGDPSEGASSEAGSEDDVEVLTTAPTALPSFPEINYDERETQAEGRTAFGGIAQGDSGEEHLPAAAVQSRQGWAPRSLKLHPGRSGQGPAAGPLHPAALDRNPQLHDTAFERRGSNMSSRTIGASTQQPLGVRFPVAAAWRRGGQSGASSPADPDSPLSSSGPGTSQSKSRQHDMALALKLDVLSGPSRDRTYVADASATEVCTSRAALWNLDPVAHVLLPSCAPEECCACRGLAALTQSFEPV